VPFKELKADILINPTAFIVGLTSGASTHRYARANLLFQAIPRGCAGKIGCRQNKSARSISPQG
jgi:hypothetical protein